MTPQEEVRHLLEQGLAVREVARRTGQSYSYVRKQALLMGRSLSRGHRNAEDHPWKKARL